MRRVLPLLVISLLLTLVPLPAVAQGTDDICAVVLAPAIQQAGLDLQVSAPVFGCAQLAYGSWYMRSVRSTRDENQSTQLDERARSLQLLVDNMAMDQAFRGEVQFDRPSSTLYAVGPGNVMNPTNIADQGVGTAPNWLNNHVDLYTQAMQTYLTRTAGQIPDLVEYMQWFMARRDATLTSMAGGMNPMASTALLSTWGYQQFPWLCQLSDQGAIAAYTGQGALTVTPDVISLPDPTPAPGSTETPVTTDGSTPGADLRPIFSPSQLSMTPGDDADITVSLPQTDFGGSFILTVSIPSGIELIDVPLCRSSGTCTDVTLNLEMVNRADGSTFVTMSGLLHDRPADLALTLSIPDGRHSGTSLFLSAQLAFASRSAPLDVPTESTLEVVIEEDGAESADAGSSGADAQARTP